MRTSLAMAALAFLAANCGAASIRRDMKTTLGQNTERELRLAWGNFPAGNIVIRKVADHTTYSTYYLVMRSLYPSGLVKNDFIPGDFMRQRNGSKKLAVLLSGMGETVSTMTIADSLVQAGYDVLRLYPGIQLFDFRELDAKEHWSKEEFRIFVRRGRDVLRIRYKDLTYIIRDFKTTYNYPEIGIMGISLGGISAYYLSGSYPELFQSTIGVITGGSLCEILIVSEEPRIIEIRNKVFAKFDIMKDKARGILCEELGEVDPLSVAHNIDKDRALLVSNIFDTVIPYEFTRKLWRSAGRPRWKVMAVKIPIFWAVNHSFWLNGHYSSATALFLPVPLFENSHAIPYPLIPRTASSIIIDHFESTLK